MLVQTAQRNLTAPADNRFLQCVELQQGVEVKEGYRFLICTGGY